jgi:hypothetical protein
MYITFTLLWFSRKRTTYVGIGRGRSAGKEVIAEFTLLGSLDVKINKRGVVMVILVTNVKWIK